MEDGEINGDQNFYSRRQFPATPERHQRTYDSVPLPDFDSRSPQLPPKVPFLTTQNLQAVTTNGFISTSPHASLDPDDFYRDYPGLQHTTNGYNDHNVNAMPAMTIDARSAPSASNGQTAVPKYPIPPSARHKSDNIKTTYRSASSPIDSRNPALGGARPSPGALLANSTQRQQPSVKDLLKRFDQNNGQSSVPPRKPSPRVVTKDLNASIEGRQHHGYQARNPAFAPQTTPRVGSTTRDVGPARVRSPPTTRATQRTRFAAEDQHSNNTVSSVARAPRPKNLAPGTNSQASKSLTNLSPTIASHPAPPPSHSLFGEVNASKREFEISHGIPRAVGRRTSESSLNPPSWLLERNKLDDDLDASSPTTGWYRGATTLDVAANRTPRSSLGHNRNHSDMPDHQVNTFNGVNPTFSTTAPTPTTPHESHSRIPVKTSRHSGSSQSSSVASSRSTSRAASPSNRIVNPRFHRPEQKPWNSGGSAAVPKTRSRTPTRPRGTARNAELSSNSNASLKAYISAPLPKLSPPLRSSRPRLPVSSASTSGSRQRATERSGSPQQVRTGMRVVRNSPGDARRATKSPERGVDSGPVDFEAHRAKIKRAYTKSLLESEQAEVRMANMRRLEERQAQNELALRKQTEELDRNVTKVVVAPEAISQHPQTLHIDTSFATPKKTRERVPIPPAQDSPTLGALPGAFVHDEEEPPQSAISNSTEIENEPQTEAPRLSRMVSAQSIPPVMTSQAYFNEENYSPEQAMFGIANIDQEIQIMLDDTPPNLAAEMHGMKSASDETSHDLDNPANVDGHEDHHDYTQTLHTVIGLTSNHNDISPTSPVSNNQTSFESDREQDQAQFSKHFSMSDNGSNFDAEASYFEELLSPHSGGKTDNNITYQSTESTTEGSIFVRNDVLQTPITDFDYESSDTREHVHRPSYLEQDGLLSSGNAQRTENRLSSWTDHSQSTNDDYQGREKYHSLTPSFLSFDQTQERRPTPPPKENANGLSPSVPPKPRGYSPAPSPRFPSSSSYSLNSSQNQVSPMSVGTGFETVSEDMPPGIVSVTPLWPTYAPVSEPPSVRETSPLPPSRSPPPPLADEDLYLTPGLEQGSVSRDQSRDVSGASTSASRSSSQIQLSTSTSNEPVIPSEVDEKAKKRLLHRRKLIEELINTEASYLKDMNIVEEIYKGTAEACPKLDANDISLLFRNSAKLIAFSTKLFEDLKSAAASVYSLRTKARQGNSNSDGAGDRMSTATTLVEDTDEQRDSKTFIGTTFKKHVGEMKDVYATWLKNSDAASARLITLQQDASVKVWLGECNLVAKDLTQAWDLDSLIVKPFQRITRYKILLDGLLDVTPESHSDRQAIKDASGEISTAILHVNALKAQTQIAGKAIGRKRKESDVRLGLAKAFGRRSEKAPVNVARPADDEIYVKLNEKYQDDFLRLQVVLRDVEFYTRQCTTYVNDFLRYLSSIELIMRMSASSYPELESKWARFNMSMRDMGTIALEDHITSIKQKVIEPFEQVIKLYGPPGLTMKRRTKRRLDYEKYLTTKSKDPKVKELVDQYEALNELLKLELPKLSSLTESIGKIALFQLVNIQAQWYHIWQEKVKVVLEESQMPKNVEDIVDMFSRDFKYAEARAWELGIVNKTFGNDIKARPSQSTQDDDSVRGKPRPSNLSSRSRGVSVASDQSPSLPTPDFAKRNSGNFTFSPITVSSPGLPQPYSGPAYAQHYRNLPPASPLAPETASSSRQQARPSTSRSHTSDQATTRVSTEHNAPSRRESDSNFYASHYDGPPSSASTRPYSGLFNSALPDGPEDSRRSSRASSQDRGGNGHFNPRVLYLAASLFEFNISATKSEAGYTYLTYQAGEIFDVLAEKGELWLAKNQDDPSNVVGWIWSKHFARLATD